ncbi:MAG: hypothetical protein ACOYJG_11000 [Prevotella sp.]|jgi:hypothetical protein
MCDNGGYYVYDGFTYRPLDKRGISTVGRHVQFQVCNVFDNWLDYLAFQERRHQTGQYLLANDYFLILNGKSNLEEAMRFLRLNPDFMEVRSFMPDTEEGRFLTARVKEATKGTAVDCSSYYAKSVTLLSYIHPKLPKWYLDIIEEQECQKREEEQVRKAMESKKISERKAKVKLTPKGEEQEIILNPRRGGFKL